MLSPGKVEEALRRIRPALVLDGWDVELVAVRKREQVVVIRARPRILPSDGGPSPTRLKRLEDELRQHVPALKGIVLVPGGR